MRKKIMTISAAALIGLITIAAPNKAEAYSRGWWIPGAILGGLAIGTIISGAYGPYYYGPGPYYYYYPRPYYYAPRYYYRPYRYYRYRPYRYYRPYRRTYYYGRHYRRRHH